MTAAGDAGAVIAFDEPIRCEAPSERSAPEGDVTSSVIGAIFPIVDGVTEPKLNEPPEPKATAEPLNSKAVGVGPSKVPETTNVPLPNAPSIGDVSWRA
jgi:hypothetical protein